MIDWDYVVHGKPRKAIPKQRKKPRRTSVHRDRGYLDWLAAQKRCLVCEILGRAKVAVMLGTIIAWMMRIFDPAHGPPAGMRVKGPDSGAIYLCRWHHNEQETMTWPKFEAKYGFDRETEAAKLYARYWEENADA